MGKPRAIVCLTAGEEFYSKAIRSLTGANINHAFLAYTSQEWGGWWSVQIDQRGVVKVPVENVEYNYIECYDFFDLDLTSAMPRVRDLVGEKYDWIGISGFLIKLGAWRLLGRKIGNPLHKNDQLFCSEFVTTYLQRCDGMYDWINILEPSSVAPGGSPSFLGTPSLQWEFQTHPEFVRRIDCPW